MVWIHDPAKKPMSPPLASRTQLDMTYSKCKEEIVEDSSPPAEKTGADSRRLSEDEPLRKKVSMRTTPSTNRLQKAYCPTNGCSFPFRSKTIQITVSPESHWCEKVGGLFISCPGLEPVLFVDFLFSHRFEGREDLSRRQSQRLLPKCRYVCWNFCDFYFIYYIHTYIYILYC